MSDDSTRISRRAMLAGASERRQGAEADGPALRAREPRRQGRRAQRSGAGQHGAPGDPGRVVAHREVSSRLAAALSLSLIHI